MSGSPVGLQSRVSPVTSRIGRITEAEWNALLDGFADANIYQTWAYGSVHWGEKQLSHLVLLRDGVPAALAQLRIVRLPLLRSGIAYVRRGPLCIPRGGNWDHQVCRASIRALLDEYVGRQGLVLRIVPNSFQQDPMAGTIRNICDDFGLVEDVAARKYSTFRVDLTPSLDVLRRQLSSRWRRQLNIAERNDLEIVQGRTDDLFQHFLTLYREMIKRKQFDTSVDPEQFRRMQQQLPESQKMMMLICFAGTKPIAGLIVATVGKTAIYLLAATGDEGLQARGSYLLQWRALQLLKGSGIEWYDLGGVNQANNPGVFTFKSGMGGEAVQQLGLYQFRSARLSSLSVSVGESIHKIVKRFAGRH